MRCSGPCRHQPPGSSSHISWEEIRFLKSQSHLCGFLNLNRIADKIRWDLDEIEMRSDEFGFGFGFGLDYMLIGCDLDWDQVWFRFDGMRWDPPSVWMNIVAQVKDGRADGQAGGRGRERQKEEWGCLGGRECWCWSSYVATNSCHAWISLDQIRSDQIRSDQIRSDSIGS